MRINKYKSPVLAGCLITGLWLAGTGQIAAQFGGGGMGMGGGGGMSRSRSGSSTARQYPNSGTIGDAMISSDPETRKIIVIADDDTIQHISQVITNLDRPKPQVLIKVVFLEVTYRNGLDLGVEGTYKHNISNNTTGALSSSFGLASQSSGGIYKIMSDDFTVTMRAMGQDTKLEVLSRPSILARNNQQATITVGETLPFITNTRITDTGQTINTVEYQDIGIILRVTPFITSDGSVEMIVAPEITSRTADTVPISDTVSAPVIAKRSAETVVVTPDGKTVIIGGLMENSKTASVSKVPFFGDIPLLGAAFKHKITENTKKELMIFLTPKIVKEPKAMAALTKEETAKAEMAPKAFSEADFDKFFDTLPVKEDRVFNSPPPAPKKPAPKAKKTKK